MTRSARETRLSKLEGALSSDIPVWCDDEAEMEMTIDDMIRNKEIASDDRARCVYWMKVSCSGEHERRLGLLAD